MSLACGIVGLPNVGKSTLFNAITNAGADAANYPFCTIDPNVGMVPVPDARLAVIREHIETQEVVPAMLKVVDIAGLVAGASRGEGLGNQFLSHIRETDAILHVVRCFEDDDVTHVSGRVDPLGDVEVIETELALADLDSFERAIERHAKRARGDRDVAAKVATLQVARDRLAAGERLRGHAWTDAQRAHLRELFPLTMKKVLYVANVDQDDLAGESGHVAALRAHAEREGAETVVLCADLEAELAAMEPGERAEFLAELELEEPGLDRLARKAFALLGLQTFFTAGPKAIRAWTIRAGDVAPRAAGVIHTDLEKRFIRAEVYSVEDLVECGSEAAIRAKGRMRVEGREYVVQDSDVVYFLTDRGG